MENKSYFSTFKIKIENRSYSAIFIINIQIKFYSLIYIIKIEFKYHQPPTNWYVDKFMEKETESKVHS